MMRMVLMAGLAIAISCPAAATIATVTGNFSATGWTLLLPDAAPPQDMMFLQYSVSFDPTQTYAGDSAALTIIDTNIPYPLRFSFNPVSLTFVLATDGNPDGCTLSAGSFCALGFNVQGGIPSFVAQAPMGGGAWAAQNITDISRVGLIGIPEPASWTMLVAGFGMVGAMRRRCSGLAV